MVYDKLIYAFIVVLVVVIFAKERLSLGCTSNPLEKCDNENGVAVVGTVPNASDSKDVLLKKISKAGNYTSRFVTWRKTIVIAFIAIAAIWGLILKRIPSGWELLLGMTLIFVIITSVEGFYKYHLYDIVAKNVDDSVDLLRNK